MLHILDHHRCHSGRVHRLHWVHWWLDFDEGRCYVPESVVRLALQVPDLVGQLIHCWEDYLGWCLLREVWHSLVGGLLLRGVQGFHHSTDTWLWRLGDCWECAWLFLTCLIQGDSAAETGLTCSGATRKSLLDIVVQMVWLFS